MGGFANERVTLLLLLFGDDRKETVFRNRLYYPLLLLRGVKRGIEQICSEALHGGPTWQTLPAVTQLL